MSGRHRSRIRRSAQLPGDMWIWVAMELIVGWAAPSAVIFLGTDWHPLAKIGAAFTLFLVVGGLVWLVNRRLHG